MTQRTPPNQNSVMPVATSGDEGPSRRLCTSPRIALSSLKKEFEELGEEVHHMCTEASWPKPEDIPAFLRHRRELRLSGEKLNKLGKQLISSLESHGHSLMKNSVNAIRKMHNKEVKGALLKMGAMCDQHDPEYPGSFNATVASASADGDSNLSDAGSGDFHGFKTTSTERTRQWAENHAAAARLEFTANPNETNVDGTFDIVASSAPPIGFDTMPDATALSSTPRPSTTGTSQTAAPVTSSRLPPRTSGASPQMSTNSDFNVTSALLATHNAAAAVYGAANAHLTDRNPITVTTNSVVPTCMGAVPKNSQRVQFSQSNLNLVSVSSLMSTGLTPVASLNTTTTVLPASVSGLNPNASSFKTASHPWVPPTNPPLAASFSQPPPTNRSSHGGLVNISLPPASHAAPSTSLLSAPPVDLAGRIMALEILKKKPDRTFSGRGEEQRYFPWKNSLITRMDGLNLSASDRLEVLLSHTSGDAKKLVSRYEESALGNPEVALENVWKEFQLRFGDNYRIESNLRRTLDTFPALRQDGNLAQKLYDLRDICNVIKSHQPFVVPLQSFNFPDGQKAIIAKLPKSLESKWQKEVAKTRIANTSHPNLEELCSFLHKRAIELDTEVSPNTSSSTQQVKPTKSAKALATSLDEDISSDSGSKSGVKFCPIHCSSGHDLVDCHQFHKFSMPLRKKYALANGYCQQCMRKHSGKCASTTVCDTCKSSDHHTCLHPEKAKGKSKQDKPGKPKKAGPSSNTPDKADDSDPASSKNARESGTRSPATGSNAEPVGDKKSLCTTICGLSGVSRNCTKIFRVNLHYGEHTAPMEGYALLDEQSDTTFAASQVFDHFSPKCESLGFTLSTMGGTKHYSNGRVAHGFHISSASSKSRYTLPLIYEVDDIPAQLSEMASPELVRKIPHLKRFSSKFVEVDSNLPILLLVGRDAGDLMRSHCHGSKAPFAFETPLGWAIVGETCLDRTSKKDSVTAFRVSTKSPPVSFHAEMQHNLPKGCNILPDSSVQDGLPMEQPIPLDAPDFPFTELPDDNEKSFSKEDKQFLKFISDNVTVNSEGHIEMPLPFRAEEPWLPSNQNQVWRRTKLTLQRLCQTPSRLEACLKAMGKNISAGHVEPVPSEQLLIPNGKGWWIPVFPVEHPKKKKTRLVFDSSAEYHGTSLNKALLQGPNTNNRLCGVLTRFRQGKVAFMADVEAMFHMFHLAPKHRDYLRFYWFKDNNPELPVVQYRAKVHIFGNRPSPAIAIYGLRHAMKLTSRNSNTEADRYVSQSFYVDDGLYATDQAEDAVQVLKEARSRLAKFKIRLHKISSNSKSLLKAFPQSECSEEMVDFCPETDLVQRTLGVSWQPGPDRFVISVNMDDSKPFTKRGVLSMVGSVYDPLGFVAPVTLQGRLLQRRFLTAQTDWDEPLPEEWKADWKKWVSELKDLNGVKIPRDLGLGMVGSNATHELHVFADASQDAIGYTAYLRSIDSSGNIAVAFVAGSSKVAPKAVTTIPRLELCAALEAASAAADLRRELSWKVDKVAFYSDSQIVLAYLRNTTKSFRCYVSRRIDQICSLAPPELWHYVATEINPADLSSRPQSPKQLASSIWIRGPDFLWEPQVSPPSEPSWQASQDLPEEQTPKTALATARRKPSMPLFPELWKTSLTWRQKKNVVSLVLRAVPLLLSKLKPSSSPPKAFCGPFTDSQVEALLLLDAQADLEPPDDSFTDKLGVLRVKGRLVEDGGLTRGEAHPILVPSTHRAAEDIVQHFHMKVKHQGRHITSGAIRQGGYHILRGAKLIRKLLSQCTLCKRLRGAFCGQQMASLPPVRTTPAPPFQSTGLDVFGPFTISEGATTRASKATKKCWGLLLTCMVSRAVHVELLPSLDINALRNALRRFVSIRGSCSAFYSDRGTNFVAAANEDKELESLGKDLEATWKFNPPHSSHFGGVWERKIGAIRRALEATLFQHHRDGRALNRDELTTLFHEAAAIVNSTPLWEVGGPADPQPLSPAMLLTQRSSSDQPDASANQDAPDASKHYGKRRWRYVQQLADEFWERWRTGYLSYLSGRKKWLTPQQELQPGDVVLMRDKAVPRLQWPMGRVVNVKPSHDGLVRTVDVLVSSSRVDSKSRGTQVDVKKRQYTRPVHELVLLIPANVSV